MSFAQWLKNADPTSTLGQLSIIQARWDVDYSNPPIALSQQWITATVSGGTSTNSIQHLTFNTPVNAAKNDMGQPNYCGRVVFSDFHVITSDSLSNTFPTSCMSGPMTDQEMALAFMLFDLSSCVQSDQAPPIPPIT
jgi:hypothetical protein